MAKRGCMLYRNGAALDTGWHGQLGCPWEADVASVRTHGQASCPWHMSRRLGISAGIVKNALAAATAPSGGIYSAATMCLAGPSEAVARSAPAPAQPERITELFTPRICARISCRPHESKWRCAIPRFPNLRIGPISPPPPNFPNILPYPRSVGRSGGGGGGKMTF
jgi:hypothetical protein